jgi:hypothetical protein
MEAKVTDLTHPVRWPAFRGLLKALIEEARRRARRRRVTYGGVGLSTAVAGATVIAVLQGPANPHSGSPEVVADRGAQVAPSAHRLPSPAGATNVILNQGDVVLVQGSNLLCRFETDELKLACILSNSSGPLPRSWGTSMRIDGTVEVFQFDASGTTTKKEFRTPLGVAAQGKIYRLKVGDRYRAGSTRIACRVKPGNSPSGHSPVAHCYYIAPKRKKTTHEFAIDNFFAEVFSVQLTLNQAGKILHVKKVKTLYAKRQPPFAR